MSTIRLLQVQESVRQKSLAEKSVILALAELHEATAHRLTKLTVNSRNSNAKKLSAFFLNKPLNRIRPRDLEKFQAAMLAQGKATSTINEVLSLLTLLLRRAGLWYKFTGLYKELTRTEPIRARALETSEIERLFAVAFHASKPRQVAAHALILALSTGMRQAEIKNLRWQDVSFANLTLSIRKSKTPAGWRTIALNDVALRALETRCADAVKRGFYMPEFFVFPSKQGDPTKPVNNFYMAWCALRKAAGVQARFHDCRHTAVTILAEAGVPDAVIRAQVGHASQQILNLYTHPRSAAMRQAADVLNFPSEPKKEAPCESKPESVPVPARSGSSPTSSSKITSKSAAVPSSATKTETSELPCPPGPAKKKATASRSSKSRRPLSIKSKRR